MTKVKKEKTGEEETGATEKSYQELLANINPIANPLASRKLSKKLYKCVKKGKKCFIFVLLIIINLTPLSLNEGILNIVVHRFIV